MFRLQDATEAQVKRDRRRPMKTFKETLKKDMEYLKLTKDIAKTSVMSFEMNS